MIRFGDVQTQPLWVSLFLRDLSVAEKQVLFLYFSMKKGGRPAAL